MNKKGMTLIEIIISIVLISIVLIFLFSLLITVKDINDESEVNSTYLINKSLILKNIEEDLSKAESVSLDVCDTTNPIQKIYSEYGKDGYFTKKNGDELDEEFKANNCIKFNYTIKDDAGNPVSSEAYLGIYYYKNKESYVISYIHDAKNVKATRELPDFHNTASVSGNQLKEWKHNNNPITIAYINDLPQPLRGFNIINIPIIGSDGKDYSINISYYKP